MKEIDQTQEIVVFIDNLRDNRNMNQGDFLHNIVSMRQYRRYLSGESTMSFTILDQLAKRLDFDAELIIMELETKKIVQTQQINQLYNAVVGKDLSKARNLFSLIDTNKIISKSDLQLYNHALNMYDFITNKIIEIDTILKTKQLVGYEELLKRKALNTSELLILVSFFNFNTFKESNIIAEKLASFIEKNITVVTGHNIKIVTLVLEELSRYFSMSENYSRMLYYAQEGIKYAISVRSIYLLDTLYYFAAAAAHELKQNCLRDEYLKKCYILLMIDDNLQKQQRFKHIFKERFDVDVNTLLLNN